MPRKRERERGMERERNREGERKLCAKVSHNASLDYAAMTS